MPRFRFHDELNDLLRPDLRDCIFEWPCAERATAKHAIEALGVPHTEVGRILVDGRPVGLGHLLRETDSLEVFPAAPPDLAADASPPRFLADGDGRIVLSRDRGLLEHRRVTRGRYVRARDTDGQLREVVARFGLRERARPFTRCLECNGLLRTAGRDEVAHRLPPRVAGEQSEFTLCTGCGRVYWPGSHWRRLRAVVDAVLGEGRERAAPDLCG